MRPNVQQILDLLVTTPAFVFNARADLLAANKLGEAFFSDLFADTERPVNTARFAFLNPRASEFFVDWHDVANDVIGVLRAEAGRDPYDKRVRPHRWALDPQRGVPRPVGCARRQTAPHRDQALPPPTRR